MSVATSSQKRQRAAAFTTAVAVAPVKGVLNVTWASQFDALCHMVSTEGMPVKHRSRYEALMKELMTETGCTEEEVIAHGLKVRALLYFAEERLNREGALAALVGKEQLPYHQAVVTPAF